MATFLLAASFVVMTFVCTYTVSPSIDHAAEKDTVCASVVELASNVIVQTGITILLLIAAIWVISKVSFSFLSNVNLHRLQLATVPIQFVRSGPREYCYLQKLFSSGIIHSKLHTL